MHYEKFADGSVKCIEDEIPFELLEGWEWTRLGCLAQYKKGPFGSSITKAMFVPDSSEAIKIYEQKNAINKDAALGNYFISAEKYETLKGFEVFPNDIIVSCAGTIGETYVLPMDMRRGIINQALMKISLYDLEILDFYLMYFDFQLKSAAQEQGHGIALKNIPPFDVLKRYLVPIPPIQEQQRIMTTAKRLLEKLKSISIDGEEIAELLSKTKSKILDLAIRGQLVPQNPDDEPASVLLERIHAEKEEFIKQGKIKRNKKESIIFKGADNSYYEKIGQTIKCIDTEIPFELPNSWLWCRLESIGKWQTGSTPSRKNDEYYGGSIPWIKTGDLNNGYIIDIPEYITEKALNETAVKLIPAGTILIAMYGATIGKVGITTCEATTNQACCACCNPYGILPEYLFYYLQSQKENFINIAEGGAQPNISKEKIIATLIPVPSYKQQAQIINIIKIFNKYIELIEKGLS